MEIKKILVPTDFSDEANNACKVAVDIARKTNASISLLHIIDVPVVGHTDYINIFGQVDESDDPEMLKPYMSQLVKATRAQLNTLKEKYGDVEIKEHIVFDSFQRHLSEFVVADATDLIVMGSKGANGIEEILVGSNTEKVIRLAKAPVLTVKQFDAVFDPKNIVFASSFTQVTDKAIAATKYLQEIFGATLHMVKIITPNAFETTPETLGHIKKFAVRNEFTNYQMHAFNYYSEEEGIRAFSDTVEGGMTILTTHGRTGIGHLLLGSIAEEVANHAVKPILTFNKHYK
jgi:nucleotide-binding universal stress UspA family protein